jgi:hypothetical protein
MSASITSMGSRRAERQQREADEAELEQLRRWYRDLEETPAMELVRQLDQLRRIERAAGQAMAKVAEHERRGWRHIAVGAFAELRDELEDR